MLKNERDVKSYLFFGLSQVLERKPSSLLVAIVTPTSWMIWVPIPTTHSTCAPTAVHPAPYRHGWLQWLRKEVKYRIIGYNLFHGPFSLSPTESMPWCMCAHAQNHSQVMKHDINNNTTILVQRLKTHVKTNIKYGVQTLNNTKPVVTKCERENKCVFIEDLNWPTVLESLIWNGKTFQSSGAE